MYIYIYCIFNFFQFKYTFSMFKYIFSKKKCFMGLLPYMQNVYSAFSTLHNVYSALCMHCTLHFSFFTLQSANCTVLCILHTVHYVQDTHCTLQTVHCTLQTSHCILHNSHCTTQNSIQ